MNRLDVEAGEEVGHRLSITGGQFVERAKKCQE